MYNGGADFKKHQIVALKSVYKCSHFWSNYTGSHSHYVFKYNFKILQACDKFLFYGFHQVRKLYLKYELGNYKLDVCRLVEIK